MSSKDFSKQKIIFKNHDNLIGKHAILSPSKYTWKNYGIDEEEKLYSALLSSYATTVGTNLHYMASYYINRHYKLRKSDLRVVVKDLSEFMQPFDGSPPRLAYVPIQYYDIENKFPNLANFVNDTLGFDMLSEQPLYYSENCFGTADAISFSDDLLRIHDYKSGTTPAHMEQLYIYAALFCLEYKIPVSDIRIETRIYQSDDILYSNPGAEDIAPIMDRIITFNKRIESYKNEGK